jgi:hypothetical protein
MPNKNFKENREITVCSRKVGEYQKALERRHITDENQNIYPTKDRTN